MLKQTLLTGIILFSIPAFVLGQQSKDSAKYTESEKGIYPFENDEYFGAQGSSESGVG
ncbi:MAG: hypothetical protein K9I74_01720 [Bacteroidales bacterium]|nr:hypothetical protein [Bacteroidales bacterium]